MTTTEVPAIEHIVISGGGIVGIFNLFGIVARDAAAGRWDPANLRTFWGTSAGAIISFAISVGLGMDEIRDYLIERPWQNLLRQDMFNIPNFFTACGFIDVEFVWDSLKPIFGAADMGRETTLLEHYERTKKELHLIAIDIMKFEVVDFSRKSHPDVRVIDAIYRSCSLPLIFIPQRGPSGEIYIDGGVLQNYPARVCAEGLGVDAAAADNIIGYHIIYNQSRGAVENVWDFIQTFGAGCLLKMNEPAVHFKHEVIIVKNKTNYDAEENYRILNSRELRRDLMDGIL